LEVSVEIPILIEKWPYILFGVIFQVKKERTHNITNSCLSQPCQFLQIGVFNLRSVWDMCLLMVEKCVLMIPHVVHALSTSMELELVWHIIFIDQDPSFMILALSYFQYEMLSIPLSLP